MSNEIAQRGAHIGLAVALGVALLGFLLGTGTPEPHTSPLLSSEGTAEGVSGELQPARSYLELRQRPRGDSANLAGDLVRLGNTGVLEPVSLEGTSKPLALQDRAANRAYDGAPPTIPHAVQQSAAAECMACHEAGMTLRGHRASPIPHEAMGNCLQCHVVQDGPQPGERLLPDAPTAAVNSFAGLTSPEAGERAWSIAPPVVPHSTQLRERCLSCHGPGGRDAMRSTHPDRQSCTQCHALQAESEQRPLSWSAEP